MDYKLILYQFLQTHHTSERQQGELLIRLWEWKGKYLGYEH